MGKKDILWQDSADVLALFGKTVTDARKSYAVYVSKCAAAGRRPELTGGGLIRSAGGWRAIWSQHGRTVRSFSQTADLSGACTDKLFSRARAEDFGSRGGPTDEHRSFIRQPSLGKGAGKSGVEEYEQSIA